MSPAGRVMDPAEANPLGRLIRSALSAAASAFGVALIAAQCHAVAAASESASIRPFTFHAKQAAGRRSSGMGSRDAAHPARGEQAYRS